MRLSFLRIHAPVDSESGLRSRRLIDQKLEALAASLTRSRRLIATYLGFTVILLGATGALLLAQGGLIHAAGVVLGAGVLAASVLVAWHAVGSAGRQSFQAFELAAARLAERLAPELGTAPSSAVEFAGRLAHGEVPFSRELAEEHLARTDRVLADVDLVARLAARRHRRRQQVLVGLGLAVVVALVATATLHQGRRRLLSLILDPTAPQLVDVPLAADLRITYRYPAYTGLSQRVVEGGDGSIAAVVGTEIELSALADEDLRQATFAFEDLQSGRTSTVPMQVDGRRMTVRFQVSHDARYYFSLVTRDGDKLEERLRHPIQALPDAHPEIALLAPTEDVEIKDHQVVSLAYAAKDDFGVSEVALVVEVAGGAEPKRVRLAGGGAEVRREGSYKWSIAELGLAPDTEGRFYLEAVDNDTISGPKRTASSSRRLVVFSAQKHHAELLGQQQRIFDGLVDWLGEELVSPHPASGAQEKHLATQRRLVATAGRLATELTSLVVSLRHDELAEAGVIAAFNNVREHVHKAEHDRSQLLTRAASGRGSWHPSIAREQKRAVAQLERDIIYLDDLLAVQRIDELKRSAKDLLAAQRNLQKLLAQYRETKDPTLRAELERRISELKSRMLDLLARMATIKQQLPGEYRNLESAAQLATHDQLERIEQMLKAGDVDAAARELEQLADMIEQMSDHLEDAEESFGGERYAEIRERLAAFAQAFAQLEREQGVVAKQTQELAKRLRDKTLQRTGASLDNFVEKARAKAADALTQLDRVDVHESLLDIHSPLGAARQRLLDADGLLGQQDFAEALHAAEEALREEQRMQFGLEARLSRYGNGNTRDLAAAAEAGRRAQRHTRELATMLAKLFPDAEEVLSKEQLAQMHALARRQAELERQAGKLGEKMDDLAGELPLFGGAPRASLEGARSEMDQAAENIQSGELPGGAQHGRRANDELAKLRSALEQASRGGRGSFPLPLGMGQDGGPGDRGGDSGQMGMRREEVHIPETDKGRAAPQFRKELLEAAKQKPPEHYEDAVRRYYEELIR